MKKTIIVLGWLAVLMGIVHISFVLPVSEFRLDHLWFIGSGIAIVFAGFMNVLGQVNQRNRTSFILVFLSNVIMCFLFTIGTFVLREPQVYFGVILFAILSILTYSENSEGNI